MICDKDYGEGWNQTEDIAVNKYKSGSAGKAR